MARIQLQHNKSAWISTLSSLPVLFVLLAFALISTFPDALLGQSVTFAGTTHSVDFGNLNLCATGATSPAPCSKTLTLSYNVTSSGTLGTTKVLTLGGPNLDFQLAGGTCAGQVKEGTECTVKVKFAPLFAGSRKGGVLVVDQTGKVLATTLVYGAGLGPQIGFNPATPVIVTNYYPTGATPGLASGAIDAAGNLFLVPEYPSEILEQPADGGPQVVIPLPNFADADSLTLDGAGDLFANMDAQNSQLIEVPVESTAFITLSTPDSLTPAGVSVDGAGDLFTLNIADPKEQIVELPAGGGDPIPIPFPAQSNLHLVGIDGLGDVFSSVDLTTLLELPAGGGTPIASTISNATEQLSLNGMGDVYLYQFGPNTLQQVPAGGGDPVTLATLGNVLALTVDVSGDPIAFNVPETDPSQSIQVLTIKRAQAAPLNFGATMIGNSLGLPLTIMNTGTGTLAIDPSMSNANFKIGATSPDNCLAGINAGKSCLVQVEFAPVAGGPQSGTLTLASNAETNPAATVDLHGRAGIAAPVLSLASGVYASAQTLTITDATPGATIYYSTNSSYPTTTSAVYTGPIQVKSTNRYTAIAVVAGFSPSLSATAVYNIMPAGTDAIDFAEGFAQAKGPMQFNGNTKLDGSRLQLTDTAEAEAASAYYATPVNIQSFGTDFTFQLTDPAADGFTFVIQNSGVSALGGSGQRLGYEHIGKSIAIKFDLYDNAGEGPNSTGLYVDGALPTVPAISLAGSGIDLHSGNPILAQIRYSGTALNLILVDTVTQLQWSHTFTIDIPGVVGSDTALVGFTASTGGSVAKQEILSWTYVAGFPGYPAAVPPLPAGPAFGGGFNPAGLFLSGSASIVGTSLQLTNSAKGQAGSAFYSLEQNVQSFSTDFTFLLSPFNSPDGLREIADGITFTMHGIETGALGSGAGGLGYAGIPDSLAIKFDTHNNAGEGPNSTGLYLDGAMPTVPAIDLTDTHIDLHSGDAIHANISYDGATLVLTLTDTVTLKTWSHSFATTVPAQRVFSTVGFTGGTGGLTSDQQILNWTFTSN